MTGADLAANEGVLRLSAFATVFAVIAALEFVAPRRRLERGRWARWPANLWLWRLHRVHHSDVGFDLTTGVRFHPGEVLLSLAFKGAVVVALGASPTAALLFELTLSLGALFTHANVRLPSGLDRILRLLFVTPDMHRVHHSVVRAETDSNFGFGLSVWDRLAGLYRRDAAAGQSSLVFGLSDFRSPEDDRLDRLIIQPFRPIREEPD
jgi:hypothetical protein